jgi:glyoxylate/hydroxypyruvate reductase
MRSTCATIICRFEPLALLVNIDSARGEKLRSLLSGLLPEQKVILAEEDFDPATIHHLLTWKIPDDMARFTSLQTVFSVGAGVDQFTGLRMPQGTKLVRLVAPGLAAMMQEYVAMAVLGLHRDLPAYIDQQRERVWKMASVPPPAGERRVGVMGLGELGRSALAALAPFGFPLAGWARGPHRIEGVECFHGPDGMGAFLTRCDILICLLPLTPQTEGILNAELFSQLPRGAALVHVGRGRQLNHADLTAALEAGQLRAAVLDVVHPEPLPQDHPFWNDPRIVLTPHIACITQVETLAPAIAANLKRHAKGEPMQGEVALERGY